MVVRVEGTAPADEIGHLAAPVHHRGNLHRDVHADFLQLLRRDLRHVHAHLIARADADDEADPLAVAIVETILALFAARRLQQRLRAGGVVVVAFHVFFIIHIALERAVGDLAVAQQYRVDDGLAVDGAAEGGNQVGVLLPVGIPEIIENASIIGGFHLKADVAIVFGEQLRVLGRDVSHVQLAGHELKRLGVVIGDDLEHDGVDVRRALEIVLILHQRDGLTRVPGSHLIGAGADGKAEEIRGLHVLSLKQMLRQDADGHVLQKRRVVAGEREGHGVVVDDLNFGHILVVGGDFRLVGGIHDGLNGEFHVLGGEGFAVVEGHVFLQMEGVGVALRVVVPALGQTRNHVVLRVVSRQTVEQQQVDLAMLVEGGIDAGVVAAAIDQRALAQRRDGNRQRRQNPQKRHPFLHKKHPPRFVLQSAPSLVPS